MKRSRKDVSVGLTTALIGFGLTLFSGAAANPTNQTRPLTTAVTVDRLNTNKLDQSLQFRSDVGELRSSVVAQGLAKKTGNQQVIVQLVQPALAKTSIANATFGRNLQNQMRAEQADFMQRVQRIDSKAKMIGQTQLVLNAVFLSVDAEAIDALSRDPSVTRIAPVGHYKLHLDETVPYIGSTTVQNELGLDGSGVSVAVLDSGIDYNHADLGGSGDPADYIANDGTVIEPGTFPTAKVVGGFDFLGNVWPTGEGGFGDPPTPDPDPIDDLALEPGSFAGHGTHVADIIGGVKGVAPGADLYAVKVCASLTPSCNGISLILGMEFAVDPNGDGDPSDRVDIVNMSLGADYGQPFDDDLSAAVDNASEFGVLTVSSAGNCGDNPFCTGSPSSARTALSVAQTAVPSAVGYNMNVLEPAAAAGLKVAVRYSWTPDVTELFEGLVQYGDLDGSNLNGCEPFSGDLSGLIVAVDRGACAFTDKIRNIENAGGVLGIVMLIDASAPFNGAFGGGDPVNIPGFNISQVDGDILRAGNAVVQFGPDFKFSLAGTTVSSTARGPDMSYVSLKPEIGAPGASISAEVATGTERTPFGGTSGASPMVAGSAALLQQACYDSREEACLPVELKAKLMNSAFTDVISDTTGEVAEVTRIGAGEVRVDASAFSKSWVYSLEDGQPAISLGVFDGANRKKVRRTLSVTNNSDRTQKYKVSTRFNEAENGAVRIITRKQIVVRPGESKQVDVRFQLYGELMQPNFMNSGSQGNDPAALSANEITGSIILTGKGEELSLPWHVLARQAASVRTRRNAPIPAGGTSYTIANFGRGVAQNDAYTVFALSDEMPRGTFGDQAPMPDLRAVGSTSFPVPAGFCSDQESFVWAFALNTWDRQSHLVPVSHQISLDIDQDGNDDYVLLNRDESFNNVTAGRQLSWVFDLATGDNSAFFFAEHGTNTGNTVLFACAEQMGLSGADYGSTAVNVSAFAQDFYFGGPGDGTDIVTLTPGAESLFGVPSGDLGFLEFGDLEVLDFGVAAGDTPALGVMMFTNGDRGAGARGASIARNEALLFLAEGVEAPEPLPSIGVLLPPF